MLTGVLIGVASGAPIEPNALSSAPVYAGIGILVGMFIAAAIWDFSRRR